jgi:hypothetical protein
MASDVIGKLKNCEQTPELMRCFEVAGSSSWVAVKNLLFSTTLQDVHEEHSHKRGLVSVDGIYFIGKSLKHYLRALLSRRLRPLFLGASSGLFKHKGQILDSYFPTNKVEPESVIYMLNSTNFSHLREMEPFLDRHHVVMENFLVGPWKVIFGRLHSELMLVLGSRPLEIAFQSLSSDYSISRRSLYYTHYKFLWGYRLFWMFFRPLTINKAYVVSAYTKSDLCAALRSLNIEIDEIQHGFLGPNHVGYNYWPQLTNLPVPHRLLVYNDFWKEEVLRSQSLWSEQVEVAGRLKYDLVETKMNLAKERYLVFTGQGGFYDSLIELFRTGASRLKKANVRIYYKAHPRELKGDLEKLRSALSGLDGISIYEGSETTETLIKNSLGHISVFSSCHFDAIQFLGQTFIFDVMKDNIVCEYAELYPQQYRRVLTMDDILQEIKHDV